MIDDSGLFELYRQESDTGEHLLVLYSIAKGIRAKTVFEIGVRCGNSTKALVKAVSETGGRVYSCDLDDCSDAVPDFLKHCWEFRQISSSEWGKSWNIPIDLLMIDGNHDLKSVETDFLLFEPYLRKGGFVLMHDADQSSCASDVKEFLSGLDRRRFDIVVLPYCYGLAIIRKI